MCLLQEQILLWGEQPLPGALVVFCVWKMQACGRHVPGIQAFAGSRTPPREYKLTTEEVRKRNLIPAIRVTYGMEQKECSGRCIWQHWWVGGAQKLGSGACFPQDFLMACQSCWVSSQNGGRQGLGMSEPFWEQPKRSFFWGFPGVLFPAANGKCADESVRHQHPLCTARLSKLAAGSVAVRKAEKQQCWS